MNFLFTNKDSRIQSAPLMTLMLVYSTCRGTVPNSQIWAHAAGAMADSHHVFHLKISRDFQEGLLYPTIFLQKRKINKEEVKWLAHTHPEASGKASKWEMGSCLSLISQCKSLLALTGSNYVQFLWLFWLLCEVFFSAVGLFLHCVCRIVIYTFLATWRENCLFPPPPHQQQSTFGKISAGVAPVATHPLPAACQRILAFKADALSPLLRMQLPGQCPLLC